jgi:hypothetical protein
LRGSIQHAIEAIVPHEGFGLYVEDVLDDGRFVYTIDGRLFLAAYTTDAAGAVQVAAAVPARREYLAIAPDPAALARRQKACQSLSTIVTALARASRKRQKPGKIHES